MIIDLKTKEEIEMFKIAGKETTRILKILEDNCVQGNTGANLDELARQECEKINAIPIFLNYQGFPSSICFSKNKILVHGIPNDEKIKNGDMISIDFGLSINGFIGDTATTVCVGNKSNNLMDKCKEALYAGIKQAQNGNRLYNIGKAIDEICKREKYSNPIEYGGHGISRFVLHSEPFVPNYFSAKYDLQLISGMVIAIEPMFVDSPNSTFVVLKDGWSVLTTGLTAHFEHTILITDGYPIILTE